MDLTSDVRNLEHEEANAYRVRPCQTIPFTYTIILSYDLPKRTVLIPYPCGKSSALTCKFILWWADKIWTLKVH
jgi:hypothetical protein